MSADEALYRLAAMARADIGKYISDHGVIDWAAVKRDGVLFKEITHLSGQRSSFKMYDAQAAINTILKAHGALTEHHKHEIIDNGPPKIDYAQYQDDPAAFSIKELWSKPTPGQLAVMESVRDHVITVVKSANAVGKTFIGADISLWFLRCFRHSKVFMTAAPPLENLERLLWGEIERKMIDRPAAFVDATSKHLDIAFAPDWYINGLTIPASGTSAQREAKFSGKHAPHMLFIIDEGDAVPIEVYRGIESCMSGGHARLVVFFNPRAQTGPVYDLIKAGAHVVELSAFEHPNVKTGYTVIPGAVSRKKTVERICKWSRAELPEDERKTDDPEWFQVPAFLDGETVKREDGTKYTPLVGGQWRKVTNPALSYMTLARYPGQAENQLISRAWVEAAQQRWLVWQSEHGDNPPGDIRPIHGQDVAEFGKDKNVACFRYGGWVAPFESWGGMDVLVGAEKAAELARDKNARDSYTDATGVGSGTAPMMIRHWRKIGYTDCDARAIKVAKSPTVKVEEGEFKILRDQLWWLCREWLRTDPAAMLPPDLDPSNTLADELCAVMYRVKGGKIQVTPKEDLRKTLGRSPDKADALCLTFGDSVPKYAPSAYG
jgi:hypothetical protein